MRRSSYSATSANASPPPSGIAREPRYTRSGEPHSGKVAEGAIGALRSGEMRALVAAIVALSAASAHAQPAPAPAAAPTDAAPPAAPAPPAEPEPQHEDKEFGPVILRAQLDIAGSTETQ